MYKIVLYLYFFLLFITQSVMLFPETRLINSEEGILFRFKFNKGDQSRILSTVNEDVFINGKLNNKTLIVNRIFSKVIDIDENGNGVSEAHFMTSENSSYKHSSWGEEYKSIFKRSPTGKYEIEDKYFMPVVRDVPIFPETPVKQGGKWSAQGHEVYDLRKSFGITKPFKVPFTAFYEYKGDIKTGGHILNLIEAEYNIYFESPSDEFSNKDMNLPAVTMGHSFQKIWWNNQKGMIEQYSEEFKIVIETFYGNIITFQGTASAKTAELNNIVKENMEFITEEINKLGFENINILNTKKGLTISIENIKFLPDSAELMEEEKIKLKKIAEILKKFENDLLITGHCALRGTEEARKKISEERAEAVAEYLIDMNVRKPECIFTQGKGADEPAASNSTEEGRERNRRVEITVIDQ